MPIVDRYIPLGSLNATVQAADGPLYVVADSRTRALNVGEKIGRGDVIRTPKDARAVVRLEDGSTIEMNDRSEVSLRRTLSGTTVHVDRGNVIVQDAAPIIPLVEKQADRITFRKAEFKADTIFPNDNLPGHWLAENLFGRIFIRAFPLCLARPDFVADTACS